LAPVPTSDSQVVTSATAATPRRIFLCADDYGIAPGVDAAIRDLLVRERITGTSVMVGTETFGAAEALLLSSLANSGRRLSIGLHVTLTTPFRPLASGFRPTRNGAFPTIGRMIQLGFLRRLDPRALAAEVVAQFEAFVAAFGRPPDFVDGHQHVQLVPQVSEAVLAATRRYAPRAWVRQCGRPLPLRDRLADRKGLVIDLMSRRFRRLAAAHGLATNLAFAGTYDFAGPQSYADLFPRFVDRLPDGGLVMCHPGFVDAELERLDPLTARREQEYAFLAGSAFPALMQSQGAALA
jgi:chitin disaccharide deacetylase